MRPQPFSPAWWRRELTSLLAAALFAAGMIALAGMTPFGVPQ